jgi:hypothetical protein
VLRGRRRAVAEGRDGARVMGGTRRFALVAGVVIALLCVPLLAAVPGVRLATARGRDGARLVLRVRTRDAVTGRPLAARVHVRPAGPVRALLAGPHLSAPEDALDGEVTLRLAPGRYVVTASHGPEWSLATQTIDAEDASARGLELAFALRREVDAGDWVGADLHVHSDASPDGRIRAAARAASLALEDVQFAVATEHNRVTELPRVAGAGLTTAAGVEVTTWAPELGHFNVFPLPVQPALRRGGAPDYDGREIGELLASLDGLGDDVFVQVNHPRLDDHIAYFELHGIAPRASVAPDDPRLRFDALEVFNGFDLARPERVREVFADWLALRAAGLPIVATGNSDAHDAARQLPGYPRTYVRVPGAGRGETPPETSAIVSALKAGRAVVSNGPLVRATVLGRGPGERAVLDARSRRAGRAPLRVRIETPSWMSLARLEVWRGAERVLMRTLDASARSHDVRVDVPLAPRGPDAPTRVEELVVLVSGDRPMPILPRRDVTPLAFTNPITVE